MQESQLTIRIDKDLKDKAKLKAEKMGLNLSLVTKMFYSSFVEKENVVNIDIDFKKLNKKDIGSDLLAAIKETKRMNRSEFVNL